MSRLANDPGGTRYEHGFASDYAALAWWTELGASGDLVDVLGVHCSLLSVFYDTLKSLDLWYLQDERGWWAVSWTAPLFSGATFGFWGRSDCRQHPSGFQFLAHSLDRALTRYPVLVNTCRDPINVPKTAALGYTYLGAVPALFDGEPSHVLHLTRDAFDQAWQKRGDRWVLRPARAARERSPRPGSRSSSATS